MIRVLFVCTGNICRSPTAEGVLRAMVEASSLADAVEVDSAGTHAYHVGEAPDPRSQAAARKRGVDLSSQRARQVRPDDFERFDYVLAMDRGHHRILARICPSTAQKRLRMALEFARNLEHDGEVPDPYYGGQEGFERVLDLVEDASKGLLLEISSRLNRPL